jgi:hypothetical protein
MTVKTSKTVKQPVVARNAASANLVSTGPAETRSPPADASRNLALWNKLKRTDPRATKPFTRAGGFRGTQIDPTWRLQMMTETFGPVGKGWGYDQLEWTVHDGMVFILARAWYLDPQTGEVCHTGPQWGGNELARRRRDGTEEPNDEAFKMAMTDAVGKCLVQIGLAADVHMGQFDDSKYREESEAYFQAKSNPDVQPEAVAKFEADVKRRVAEVTDLDGLDELWRGGVSARLREIGVVDKAAQHRVVACFSQKKAELLGPRDGSGDAAPRGDRQAVA